MESTQTDLPALESRTLAWFENEIMASFMTPQQWATLYEDQQFANWLFLNLGRETVSRTEMIGRAKAAVEKKIAEIERKLYLDYLNG